MADFDRCAFTGRECDKGHIYDDGSIGCVLYDDSGNCSLMADLEPGQSPRDFYNELLIEIAKEYEENDE